RRPDLGEPVRTFLAALSGVAVEEAEGAVRQLAWLGSRGWGVLIPMLHPPRPGERFPVPDAIREAIFREAADRPAVLPLVHHHAHAAMTTATEATALTMQVFRVLKNLGAAAGMAVPDLLNLAVGVPSLGWHVRDVILQVAEGFPNTGAAMVRAIDR